MQIYQIVRTVSEFMEDDSEVNLVRAFKSYDDAVAVKGRLDVVAACADNACAQVRNKFDAALQEMPATPSELRTIPQPLAGETIEQMQVRLDKLRNESQTARNAVLKNAHLAAKAEAMVHFAAEQLDETDSLLVQQYLQILNVGNPNGYMPRRNLSAYYDIIPTELV